MKYRSLRLDELEALEPQFIRFLAVHSITSEDWVKMKVEHPEKVDELINNFSDMIFDTTLKKVEYLEIKRPSEIQTFHCEAEKITLFGLRVEGPSNLDFTKDVSPEQMMGQIKLSGAKLKLFNGQKNYSKERELELFEMMERGALISKDGYLFNLLKNLAPSSSK